MGSGKRRKRRAVECDVSEGGWRVRGGRDDWEDLVLRGVSSFSSSLSSCLFSVGDE